MLVDKLAILLVYALIFLLSTQAIQAQSAVEEPAMINRVLAAQSINGAWQLNTKESDDVLSKMQEKLLGLAGNSSSTEKVDTKQAELPSLSVSLFPPETLTVAGDGEEAITINEGFKNVVFTRTYPINGNRQIYQLSTGANFTVKAVQQNNKVVVETISPRGNKMTEIYELADAGKKLHVVLRVENAGSEEMITLNRVYDRSMMDLFLPSAAEESE